MSIDTRNKRASCIGRFGLGAVHATPDGVISQFDRRQCFGYAGFPSPVEPPSILQRNKRASAIGFSLLGRIAPYPDGDISTADRRALLVYRLFEDPEPSSSATVVSIRHSMVPAAIRLSEVPVR